MDEKAGRQRVLIIDDTPESIRVLMESLRQDYAIMVATSGEKGLELAFGDPAPDLILLDIRMPGMSGYEVCRRLKDHPTLKEIPVIFLSALDRSDDIVKAFKTGGVDYVTKPFHFDEVQARVKTHLRLRSTLKELEAKSAELQSAYDQLDQEFRSVGEVQATLLPSPIPQIDGFESASFYRPARLAGGDYFDIFPIDGGRWGVFIADVIGHGPRAAVMTAMIHVMLHLAPHKGDTDAVLAFLNDLLTVRSRQEQFVTAFYGVLDTRDRVLTFSCAGHPPPAIRRLAARTTEWCSASEGIPLGVSPSGSYPAACVNFLPGDTFLFYTDGITETEHRDAELYGMERLARVIQTAGDISAMDMCRRICASVERFRNGKEQLDDVTLLVLKVLRSE
ncbi:SpoIIE family protein phosphatase [Geomonas sp. RF6]|uniref:PP2C family protein-serine/threonine phosphatase n=1 Tax=Geomonas sp. RF6 TaxID=2897342 RepID=UPI001E584A90|nr:SpoIIE family protein phosphatase [Geomonas sp. RF6]UFS68602.1 SpoIIE family protein phosphatase [Geomonas sp. RF6]